MDLQHIFDILVALAGAAGGWFMRNQYAELREARKELNEHRIDVAKNYVSEVRFQQTMNEIREGLERIMDKLDNKEDRRHGQS